MEKIISLLTNAPLLAAVGRFAEHSGHTADTSATSAGVLLVALLVIGVVVCALLVLVLLLVSSWKLFVKAGEPGWTALVPFYNTVKFLEITNKPLWWVLLMFVPVVNIVISIIMIRRFALVFGKGVWFTVGMVLLPFIFLPILAFGRSVYVNTLPPAKPLTEATKWALIALVVFCVYMNIELSLSATRQYPTLSIIANNDGGSGPGVYATDGAYVYLNDTLIAGADPMTFSILGDGYAEDSLSVYYEGKILRHESPDVFRLLGSGYALGAHQVYYYGTPIVGADSATFQVLGNSAEYAKDANTVYYSGQSIPAADPATFAVVDGDATYDAADKNTRYNMGVAVTTVVE